MPHRIEPENVRLRSIQLHERINALANTPSDTSSAGFRGNLTAAAALRSLAANRPSPEQGRTLEAASFTEGDLFAAAASLRLHKVNPRAGAIFRETFGEALANTWHTHGELLPAKAADRILRALVRNGTLSREEYRAVEHIARAAANLDSDRTRIGTTKKMGGGVEVSFIGAVRALERNLSAVAMHKPSLRTPAVPATPSLREGRAAGALPSGFLWKPISDSTGTLAILLPPGMTGAAVSCTLLSPDGTTVVGRGRDGGVGNGGRQHFRFDRPGAEYPAGVIVAITMRDGSVHQIRIARPAARIEGQGG